LALPARSGKGTASAVPLHTNVDVTLAAEVFVAPAYETIDNREDIFL
jgi:hypothetical protein